VRKLVLKVSVKVPDLPKPVLKEPGLSVKRITEFPGASSGDSLTGYILDRAFIAANASAIRKARLCPGSIVVWGAGKLPEKLVAENLLYDEISSFKKPEQLLRMLRNLYRRQLLEKEIERRTELLKAKESENAELLQVGIALSAERDNDKLLSYILRQVRQIARADAGTLYLLERDEATGEQKMRFKIAQNDSNPTEYSEFVMPLSKKSISGYVASTGKVLNIEDAYKIPKNREYGFSKSYDADTKYRSKSMLTVPMMDHKGQILGVIQLINRKRSFAQRIPKPEDAEKIVIPFSRDIEPLVLSLASQAAVSLENNLLYQEIETLFEGFVKASVQAIESRDPTTSGHSNRVAVYTVGLAQAVERGGSGPYKNVHFTPEHLKEIRYASLLHDFGKVGVREHVLVKAKKLYPNQLDMVKMRFAYIQKAMMFSILKERFDSLCNSGLDGYLKVKAEYDKREESYMAEMDGFLNTITAANEPSVLAEDPSRILDEIHGKTFLEKGGQPMPFLTEDEYIKLKIPRGSLDEQERKEIESHVTHTFLFLRTIPWTREMRNIPAIAYGHHEKLDGDGYPRRIPGKEIAVQTRMMTISDIYDALTASDRPYKRAVPPLKALDILQAEVKDEKLDPELVKIFIESKVWEKKPDKA
jgi:HD-GYP domain-containing protein (c-di-GMP phosphodiesterase class II)